MNEHNPKIEFKEVKTSTILESYDYTNDVYVPDIIPYPTWPHIKTVKSVLEKLSHLYFDVETTAYYSPTKEENYVSFVLESV